MDRGFKSPLRLLDEAVAMSRKIREQNDELIIMGYGYYQLFDEKGKQKQAGVFANRITTVGDEQFSRRATGVSPGNLITGMRLGTGVTAASKSGAGAAIVTYKTGTALATDGTFPTNAAIGSDVGWRATYRRTWGAGIGTDAALGEVVLTNETGPTDVAGTAANTLCRALLSSTVNKAAGDTLEVTWTIDFFGP